GIGGSIPPGLHLRNGFARLGRWSNRKTRQWHCRNPGAIPGRSTPPKPTVRRRLSSFLGCEGGVRGTALDAIPAARSDDDRGKPDGNDPPSRGRPRAAVMSESPPGRERRTTLRRKSLRVLSVSCLEGSMGLGPNLAIALLDISESGARLLIKQPLKKGQE